MADDEMARDLWVAIEALFRDNKDSCAVFLSSQFHSLLQGDQSIADYSQHVKTLADALRDVGHPVSDSQLILNLLRGLNPHYSNTTEDIANLTPFPSFARARSMLVLKETRLANETKITNETALVARWLFLLPVRLPLHPDACSCRLLWLQQRQWPSRRP
ncbi:uncharacterized protein LOC133905963 [Phragmites australis]|uniref:uncharacterized protein LOC133905963 n=1 Tax=Phragmites australis TaxID=29695 RepID=UPI002D79523F|nr:uncharacterized protein LOC133905963 [Phragmites australis]